MLVAGASASSEIGYEGLFELVRTELPAVRMLGQAPFAGWAVVDFDGASGEVTLDGSLVGPDDDRPERYIAVAGAAPVAGEAYAVVRVPDELAPGAVVVPEATPVEKYAGRIDELERSLGTKQGELDAASEYAEGLEEELASRALELSRTREALDDARSALESAQERFSRTKREPVVEADDSEEHARLERGLAEAAASLREANAEVERRGVLVRDMVEEIRELRTAIDGGGALESIAAPTASADVGPTVAQDDLAALRAERDRAVARALDSEAARAEAQFAVDELMGRLVDLEGYVGDIALREADLEGRSRGLTSRLAEERELRGLEVARRALMEDDLEAARLRVLSLQREVAEVREQLELEMVRARGAPPRGDVVTGLEERLALAEDEVRVLTEERDHTRAEAMRLTALVTAIETQFDGARRGYEARIAELLHDAAIAVAGVDAAETAALRARVEELSGQISGLSARLADREAALEAARTGESGERAEELGRALDDADELRERLSDLNTRESDLTVRLADAEELAELEANRANDLASIVASRDALVARLQMDLADEERRARDGVERSDRYRDENERLREAVVSASERVSETEANEKRIRELEETLASALSRVETASSRGAFVEEGLREARGALLELGAAIDGQGEPRFGTTFRRCRGARGRVARARLWGRSRTSERDRAARAKKQGARARGAGPRDLDAVARGADRGAGRPVARQRARRDRERRRENSCGGHGARREGGAALRGARARAEREARGDAGAIPRVRDQAASRDAR